MYTSIKWQWCTNSNLLVSQQTEQVNQHQPIFFQYSVPINNYPSVPLASPIPTPRKWGNYETDLQENTYKGVSGLNLSSPSTSASWGEWKRTMIINTVLWYNRYICNSKLTLSFQLPFESTTTCGNATVSVVKKCFTVAFFCWRRFLLISKFLQSYFSENIGKKYYYLIK